MANNNWYRGTIKHYGYRYRARQNISNQVGSLYTFTHHSPSAAYDGASNPMIEDVGPDNNPFICTGTSMRGQGGDGNQLVFNGVSDVAFANEVGRHNLTNELFSLFCIFYLDSLTNSTGGGPVIVGNGTLNTDGWALYVTTDGKITWFHAQSGSSTLVQTGAGVVAVATPIAVFITRTSSTETTMYYADPTDAGPINSVTSTAMLDPVSTASKVRLGRNATTGFTAGGIRDLAIWPGSTTSRFDTSTATLNRYMAGL